MFRRIGSVGSFSDKSGSLKKLTDAKSRSAKVKPEAMLDTIHEIAIYIHRFHNLDLFQQGWYQIKITLQKEDGTSAATPARVVQYEAAAPNPGSDAAVYALWRIDNKDNSFSTQPFRIKYARQDVPFFIMVAFHLPLKKNEGPSSSAVIMKFELSYAAIWETGSEFQASIGACPAAIHEFRIPPKALLGVHSYCPVHFDAFHSVLVDVTVHISLLKDNKASPKASSVSYTAAEDLAGESVLGSHQDQEQEADAKQILLVKSLLSARDFLLEELHRIGIGIGKAVDLAEFESKMNNMNILLLKLGAVNREAPGQGKPRNGLERRSISLDFKNESLLQNLTRNEVFKLFHILGDQVLFLWNSMLKFHRENKIKILEFLHDEWAKERRAEWSIWMVYSKVELPHHYINGGYDSHHVCKKGSTLWKFTDDPAQLAAMRADLHRRSIAQMRMNNRSIQDMNIFGDPLKVPIVIVERVTNAPRRTFSHNSYMRNFDLIDTACLLTRASSEVALNQSSSTHPQNSRDLKIAVFVHGFQGHHLDLRLVRNQWLLIDPKIQFLMSETNEDKTSGDFREMGLRLAQEVVNFVEKKKKKMSRSGRLKDIKLSFVGHSIGNIILRTALAESIMEPYLKYLYTYVSLSGPHLGYLYSSNSLFNSGLWLLKKLKGTQCIHQLTFTDDPDLRNTFFYKLCKRTTLENFKHIILLCSPQDGYVPYHSARIETCRAASMDNSKKGKVFLEMLNNCLDQIRRPTSENRVFMRCDVSFDTTAYGRNLNTLIGRAAHIDFLETDIFARFIMWSFPDLFR